MARWLIVIGVVCVAAGLAWPWLSRAQWWRWIGHLPGDIAVHRDGFSFYFPITTGIVVSLVLSLIVWLLRR